MNLKELDVTNSNLAEDFSDEGLITKSWQVSTGAITPPAAPSTSTTPATSISAPATTVPDSATEPELKSKTDTKVKAQVEKQKQDALKKIEEETNKIMGIEKPKFWIGVGAVILGLIIITR